MRPVSTERRCFYCYERVGQHHKSDCGLIQKTIKQSVTFEYEVSIPAKWTAQDFEFNRNEGTRCADNELEILRKLAEQSGCLCECATFKFIEDSDKHFLVE